MRRLIISILYRLSSIAPRFFLRKIVFLCFVLAELGWYLLNKVDSSAAVRYREDSIRFVLDNIEPNERVLEVGPALGHLSRKIIKKAKFILGVEIDKEYFKKLETIKDNRIQFVNEDIEKIKLEDIFDSAILIHTLEHIKDPKGLLQYLSLHAKKIIIESPCQTSWWLDRLRRELDIPAWGDEQHTLTFDYHTIKNMLEECGWRIVFVHEPVTLFRIAAVSMKVT